jgi:hypothetical protein
MSKKNYSNTFRFVAQCLNQLHPQRELEVGKQYQITATHRFAASEILIESKDINRVWECIKENIKASAKESLYEMKQRKPWLDGECL